MKAKIELNTHRHQFQSIIVFVQNGPQHFGQYFARFTFDWNNFPVWQIQFEYDTLLNDHLTAGYRCAG